MSVAVQAALPQLMAALPHLPGFEGIVTLVLVKITAVVTVLVALFTGGILSKLIHSAVTDSLLLHHSHKYRDNFLLKSAKETYLRMDDFDDKDDYFQESHLSWEDPSYLERQTTESTTAIQKMTNSIQVIE